MAKYGAGVPISKFSPELQKKLKKLVKSPVQLRLPLEWTNPLLSKTLPVLPAPPTKTATLKRIEAVPVFPWMDTAPELRCKCEVCQQKKLKAAGELTFLKKVIRPDVAVADFYVMEELLCRAPAGTFRRSVDKFIADISEYRERFARKLANAFFDYSALIAFGEARHAQSSAAEYYLKLIPQKDRTLTYMEAVKYSPKTFLPAVIAVFKQEWRGMYGGEPWAKIAKVAAQYGDVPNPVFVDMCCGLSHKNGLFLNKEIVFHCPYVRDYQLLLDTRAQGSLLYPAKVTNGRRLTLLQVSPVVEKFIHRAVTLGILPAVPTVDLKVAYGVKWTPLEHYQPIQWGNEWFNARRAIKPAQSSRRDE